MGSIKSLTTQSTIISELTKTAPISADKHDEDEYRFPSTDDQNDYCIIYLPNRIVVLWTETELSDDARSDLKEALEITTDHYFYGEKEKSKYKVSPYCIEIEKNLKIKKSSLKLMWRKATIMI